MLDNVFVVDGKQSPRWTLWRCECGIMNGDTSRCKSCRRIFNLKEARADSCSRKEKG